MSGAQTDPYAAWLHDALGFVPPPAAAATAPIATAATAAPAAPVPPGGVQNLGSPPPAAPAAEPDEGPEFSVERDGIKAEREFQLHAPAPNHGVQLFPSARLGVTGPFPDRPPQDPSAPPTLAPQGAVNTVNLSLSVAAAERALGHGPAADRPVLSGEIRVEGEQQGRGPVVPHVVLHGELHLTRDPNSPSLEAEVDAQPGQVEGTIGAKLRF